MENPRPSLRKRLALKRQSRFIKKHARRAEGATIRHARRFLVNRWDKILEIRLHVFGWLAGVGLIIVIVGLQMVWFQQSYVETKPVKGGTYAEAVRGPIQTLNPLYATTPAELAVTNLIFSSLYSYDTTGNLRGDIAKSIQNKDDQEFTVKLRRDAHWHDGTPLTAKDIVFTINLMRDPSSRSVSAVSWQGVAAEYVNEYEVRFLLPASYAAFPHALTFAILPSHLLKDVEPSAVRENTYSVNPVGSGPFSLQLLQTVGDEVDRKIVYLNANSTYHWGRPQLDRLQLHTYKDDENMYTALRTGEVIGASDVSSDVARMVDSNVFNVISRPVNNGVYVIFNLANPVLKNKEVRTALRLATNTKAISNSLYGKPNTLHLPFLPSQVKGSDSIKTPKSNLSAAVKLLDKEGWKLKDGVRSKKGQELRFRIVTRQNTEYETSLKELIDQWSSLGVKLDAEVFDASDATKSFAGDVLQTRNYDILLDELVIGADPDVFAFWHSGGLLNFSEYGSDVADDALTSARDQSNPALRNAKYLTFARAWLSDIPAIGLYQSNITYIHTKSTRTIGPDEVIINPSDHYGGVLHWTAEKGRVYKTP